MRYLGRFQQGQEVALVLECTDGSGEPAWPDAAPAADVYSEGSLAASALALPVLQPAAVTGLFLLVLLLDGRFSGRCTAAFSWLVSGAPCAAAAVFEVAPGSDPSGAVLALCHYRRPHADYLVQQRSGGDLYQGKNPR